MINTQKKEQNLIKKKYKAEQARKAKENDLPDLNEKIKQLENEQSEVEKLSDEQREQELLNDYERIQKEEVTNEEKKDLNAFVSDNRSNFEYTFSAHSVSKGTQKTKDYNEAVVNNSVYYIEKKQRQIE